MKTPVLLVVIFCTAFALGTEVVDPPLTAETFIGTWEAVTEVNPANLWHMEINSKGDSYLAQISVGTPCVVRRLISWDIRDGVVRLHFEAVSSKDLRGVELPALWIIGTGRGIANRGGIDAIFCGNSWPDTPPPPARVFGLPEKDHMFFIKGPWTRDLGDASKAAEKAINDRASK